jgi:hypothetical protein
VVVLGEVVDADGDGQHQGVVLAGDDGHAVGVADPQQPLLVVVPEGQQLLRSRYRVPAGAPWEASSDRRPAEWHEPEMTLRG